MKTRWIWLRILAYGTLPRQVCRALHRALCQNGYGMPTLTLKNLLAALVGPHAASVRLVFPHNE